MIRQIDDQDRATLRIEQSARVTDALQAENGPWPNLRASHIRRLALKAQGLAAFHELRANAAALQAELARILEEATG